MRVHVMSDLHFEFLSNFDEGQFWRILDSKVATSPGATLVLAGDIYNLKNPKRFEQILSGFCSRYGDVLYVPGNHEHWKYSIREANQYLADLEKDPKFHNLTYVRPGGMEPHQDVLGGTLWYPDCKNEAFKAQWCDYYMISDSATAIEAEHQKFMADLMSREAPLVVSHHYPTDESIGARWVGQPTNIFFSAAIDDALKARTLKPPKLWIHGHTHDPMDYVSKYGFRVYCNPHGYPGENSNSQFWNRLEVEVAI